MKLICKKYIKLIVIFLVTSLIFATIPSTQAAYTKSFIQNANMKSAEYNNLLEENYPSVLSRNRLVIPSLNQYDYGALLKIKNNTNITGEYVRIIPDNVFNKYLNINDMSLVDDQYGGIIIPLNSNSIELSFNVNIDLADRINLFLKLIFNEVQNNSYVGTLRVYTSNNYLIKEVNVNFDDLCLATNFGSLRLNAISFNKGSFDLDDENDADTKLMQNYLSENLYKYIIGGYNNYNTVELEYTSELLSAFGRDMCVYNIISDEISKYVDVEMFNSSITYEKASNEFNTLMEQFKALIDVYNSLEPSEPFIEPIFAALSNETSSFENDLYSLLDSYIENTSSVFDDINIQEIKDSILSENYSQINSVLINQQNSSSISSNTPILISAIDEINNAIASLIASKQTAAPPIVPEESEDPATPENPENPDEAEEAEEPEEPEEPVAPEKPNEPEEPVAPVELPPVDIEDIIENNNSNN